VKHRDGSFLGIRGLKLYYQSWHPLRRVKGIVVIIHGLGSHSSLFGNVTQFLVPTGYAVYALDLRGHGRSQGQRGHINAWSEFREDLKIFFALIKTLEKGIPYFVLGHSLGGIIALDYVLHFPTTVQGVITMAPPLGKIGVSPLKLLLGKALSQILPRFALNVGFVDTSISRDQNVLATLHQDQFAHSQGSARLATEFLAINDWVRSRAAHLQVPILILHGGADQISRPEGSRAFFEQIKFADKERYEYPESRHALHRDRNYLEIVTDLKDWLERHGKDRNLIPFRKQEFSGAYVSV
jgi:alpha-beta hydrolase superfamily lysophospholipase